MPNEWVVLELSPKAEGEDPDFIRASIQHMVRDAEVYLPVSVTKRGEDRVIHYLVDGYAFIRRAHPDEKYYKLEGSRYVQSIITRIDRSGGRPVRKLACATDADIERFKSQIHEEDDQGIGVGDTILVTSGPYRQIKAIVIEDIPENDTVQVHVKLRSKESIVTLPRSFLKLVEKSPLAVFVPKFTAMQEWIAGWGAIRHTKLDALPIKKQFRIYDQIETWRVRGYDIQQERLSAQWAQSNPDRNIQPICRVLLSKEKLHLANVLSNDIQAGERLLDAQPLSDNLQILQKMREVVFYRPLFAPGSVRLSVLEKGHMEWLWFSDIWARFATLGQEIRALERTIWGKDLTDHIVIDGHNLAIRCATAPGLDTLKDSKGRPTGGIVGFLRSLGSFTKKFPGAKVTVAWDGSDQRRRGMFPGYKANRNTLRSYFEIEYLKGLLPLLGVNQVWNAEEEADDVIATLLCGAYKGQQNVVVTTDKDLLQLVSETNRVLTPAVGFGKELVYDTGAVEKKYGVPPERMVHYRAIDGDTSDNIPGAPGFGPKMASKLIKLYGTVDAVFSSNLAGLTNTQYQNLRSAEKQVKLNVKLMALHTDLPLTLTSSNPDQIAASEQLRNVDVKVESILPVFFPVG